MMTEVTAVAISDRVIIELSGRTRLRDRHIGRATGTLREGCHIAMGFLRTR